MPELSICIVNTNNIRLVKPCLDSIQEYTQGVTFEVILVDNNSSDASVAVIESTFPDVKLIQSKVSMGYTANMNMALRQAQGSYIAILNDDTLLLSNAFKEMVGFLRENSAFGAVSPRIVNPDGSFQIGPRGPSTLWALACWELKLFRIFPNSRLLSGLEMTYWNPEIPCEIHTMSGACIVVRKCVLDQVGLLEERIPLGPDDSDFSYRIQKQGWKLYYKGDVKVIHYGGTTKLHPDAIERSNISMYKGWYWYFGHHFGWQSANMFRPFVVIGALLRIIYWSFVYLTVPAHGQRASGEIRSRLGIIKLSLSPRLRQLVEQR